MKLSVLTIILFLLLPGAALAAAGQVLQPIMTVPVVTTTTTAAPAPVLTPVRILTIITPAPVTCVAPASCMSGQDAMARWGAANFAKDSEISCGSEASRGGEAVLHYCYRPVLRPVVTVSLRGPGLVTVTPAAVLTTTAPAGTPVVTDTGALPAGKVPVMTTATPGDLLTLAPAGTDGAWQTRTMVPATTPAATATAKAVPLLDAVVNFFASLFGGGTSSGGSPPPSGGDMEPTPSLPGGLKPATQVTTAKIPSQIDNTITVTSPAAGTQYFTGDVIPVKWIKPQNPTGTVTLSLVSRGGSTQTSWATAIVPNTGSFDWHQQDLAHDCGVGDNPDCWGGMNPDTLGIESPVQYQNAWNLPAYNDVAVEISTDAMDPYPAFYGSSGTFTIVNGHAFVDTKLESADYMQAGAYPPQVTSGPAQTDPWVGFRNGQNGPDPAIIHDMWRTVIVPEFGSGYYVGDTFRKATLILRIRTDKGTGNGVEAGEYDVKTDSAVARIWVLSEKPTGYKQKSELPVIADYEMPATAGSTAKGSYDPATGIVTADLTEPVNQWFTKAGTRAIVLVGPDETSKDNPGFFYSVIQNVTFIVEKA